MASIRSIRSTPALRAVSMASMSRARPVLAARLGPLATRPLGHLPPSLSTFSPLSFSRPYSSTSTKPKPAEEQEDFEEDDKSGPQPKSAYARFKLMSKKYGWWAFGMYLALSTVDFTLTFLTVHAVGVDRIKPFVLSGFHKYRTIRFGEEEADRIAKEEKAKAEEQEAKDKADEVSGKKKNSWGSRALWAEIILAYTIHKTALLPIRAGLTVAWTPKLVKWLTSRGWIGKGGFGRAATHAQGRIKDASERVKAKLD